MAARSRTEQEAERFWEQDSTPFSADPPPPQPCRVMLRQVDDNQFALQERLVLTWAPPGAPGPVPLVIEPDWLTATDLASVPDYLGWFVRRFGRHTPAALVHDVLIPSQNHPWPAGLPEAWRLPPTDADTVFRQLLSASGEPPVRTALMWTAVVARTRWLSGWLGKLSLVAWGLAAVVGSVAFVGGIATGDPVAVALGLIGPAVAALLWGRQYVAGLVAGYSLWWVAFGSVPAYLAYKAYQVVEWVVYRLRMGSHRRRGVPVGVQPAPPVPYDCR
jgi:Protein of unknown function (DUF1353)